MKTMNQVNKIESHEALCKKQTRNNRLMFFLIYHILVEEVDDSASQPAIAPVSMYQQQLLEVFKVRYCKVTGHNCL